MPYISFETIINFYREKDHRCDIICMNENYNNDIYRYNPHSKMISYSNIHFL